MTMIISDGLGVSRHAMMGSIKTATVEIYPAMKSTQTVTGSALQRVTAMTLTLGDAQAFRTDVGTALTKIVPAKMSHATPVQTKTKTASLTAKTCARRPRMSFNRTETAMESVTCVTIACASPTQTRLTATMTVWAMYVMAMRI